MFNKILRGLFLSGIVMSLSGSVFAQSYAESALLFGRTQPSGSARIQSLGGAQIALGGDYSSALSNPAGLGMFNRSEFTFTPGYTSYNTSTLFRENGGEPFGGNFSEENSSKINIPGLSYVHHFPSAKPRDENTGYVGGAFGISMSRINDFNRSTIYGGNNETSSIVDYFLEQASGSTPSQLGDLTGLAYDNYLIGPQSIDDPSKPDDEYFTDAPIESEQQEEITTKGTSYQWSFSYGGNYKDILFFGGGIGLTTLRYNSTKTFTEQYDSDIIDGMQLDENLNIRGSGVNATLGVIVRPVDFLQIGVSFTSPTYYQITEKYDAFMATQWNNYEYDLGDGTSETLNNESAFTDIIISEYNLTTPLKLSGGLAFISKYGFITGDIEMTNPSRLRYSSDIDGVSFSSDNNIMKSIYKSTVNYRVGAEFRYNIFRLRGGYNLQANTFEDSNLDNKITSISGGAGVKLSKFSIDFALINRKYDSFYSPYTLDDQSEPIVNIKNKITTGMITVGFTF
ncbi:MAG TPA: hypothetical protein VJ184_13300 [Chryseolinea sp.]|nr:hypothetical protein [Chryseolinea sp.]